jgi:hypothetical protein
MKKLLFVSHTDIIPAKDNGPNILGPFMFVRFLFGGIIYVGLGNFAGCLSVFGYFIDESVLPR